MQRRVVLLRAEGYAYAEIAQRCGISTENARQYRVRAARRIREHRVTVPQGVDRKPKTAAGRRWRKMAQRTLRECGSAR